jgi:putative transposase
MTGRRPFAIPEGWVARGWRFEVEPTTPHQRSAIAQHFGARRFAYNWALARVKASLDARMADPTVPALEWNLPAIRRDWNQAKQQVAPWWRECSKEAYACGIADLVTALHNWANTKHGRRRGQRVGFPRFKARHRDRGRVRFTTGAMRLEPDRRHIVVPVIGRFRSKENTRRLERLLATGRARILSITLTEHGVGCMCRSPLSSRRSPAGPASRGPVAGSTLGSAPSGRSSPTTTTPSSASPIPPPGQQSSNSAAGWPGNGRAGSSAPEGTARRTPSSRPWTVGRPTSAPSRCTPSPTPWHAATAR